MKYIVTEGDFDKLLLEKVIPAHLLRDVEILAGSGYSSAISMATTVLSHLNRPLILVVNSNSNNSDVIQQRYSFLYEILSLIAPDTMFNIVVIAPEIEVLFFQDINILRLLTKDNNLSEMIIGAGKFNPKKVLMELLGYEKERQELKIIDKMTDSIVLKMQSSIVVQKFIDILKKETFSFPKSRLAEIAML